MNQKKGLIEHRSMVEQAPVTLLGVHRSITSALYHCKVN